MSWRRLTHRFKRRKKEETAPAVVQNLPVTQACNATPPQPLQRCISFDEFGSEANQFFALDMIEGCRVITTRPIGKVFGGETVASHTLNLGTYPSLGGPASLLKALFQSPQGEQVGPQGGRAWSTFLKWSKGPKSFISTYSSRSESVEVRAASGICDSTSVRCGFVTSQLGNHIKHIGDALFSRSLLSGIQTLDTSQDVAMALAEIAMPTYNVTGKITYQGSPIGTVSLATRLYNRMWGGGELSWLSASGATLTNYGLRYKGDTTVVTGTLSATPNFNKPVEEGIKERIYTSRVSCAKKINERLSLGAEVEVPLQEPRSSSARIGYEVSFHQARVLGTLDSDYKLRTTVEDSSGLQLAGEMDFANDNFKFGFGFEISPAASLPVWANKE